MDVRGDFLGPPQRHEFCWDSLLFVLMSVPVVFSSLVRADKLKFG